MRERVRCSSLIDWPVYPRMAETMRASNDAQCDKRTAGRFSQPGVPFLGSVAQSGRIWSLNFFC